MQLSASEFHIISTNQETSDVSKWDTDTTLGLSVTIVKTLQEALQSFNVTLTRAGVTRCKLKLIMKYRDANQQQSETVFVLAHYDRQAKSLERYAERAREWSDHQKNPFEQTQYIHPVLNTRQLVSDAFKPTGTFITDQTADKSTKRSKQDPE
jgi:predicted S18 family serine protease